MLVLNDTFVCRWGDLVEIEETMLREGGAISPVESVE
jgi:hypothetical protein